MQHYQHWTIKYCIKRPIMIIFRASEMIQVTCDLSISSINLPLAKKAVDQNQNHLSINSSRLQKQCYPQTMLQRYIHCIKRRNPHRKKEWKWRMADGGSLRLLFWNNSIFGDLLSIWTSIACHNTWKEPAKFQLANLSDRLLSSHDGGKNGEA